MTSIRFKDMMVETAGDGTPIVMLHGLGGTSNSWQALVPSLAGFRLIRPDLPGAGRSPTPGGKIEIVTLAHALARNLAELGVERAHIVGHSFGTLIAQHLAVMHPRLAASLALFGPIIEPADAARERLRARAALARQEGMCTIADQVTPVSLAANAQQQSPVAFAFVRESHMRQDAEGFAKSCEALAGASGTDLAAIACPVLVVTGDQDGVGPPSVAQQLAETVKQGSAVVLNDCGHWAPIEKPAECARHLNEFIRKIAI